MTRLTSKALLRASVIVGKIEELEEEFNQILKGIKKESRPAPMKRTLQKVRRGLSPEAREKIADAQRKRWSAYYKNKK